ncbi:iron-sulfur cluster assembly scaffold protein [Sphingomonas sp.]|uniref:iron-sulfur cluster assembly scaffold protein n=1 Tax=Sphingomonas sp. TaxID=28214 RepID=UPI00286CC739|nr:iron-sulfur cluster assembly scaffold protein [Sphingomonas sp.]
MTLPLYTRDILRLAASIPNQKSFDELDDVAAVRSLTCGSRVAMRVALDADGRVTEIEQAVEACAFGQAAAALVGMHGAGTDKIGAVAVLASVERWLDGAGDEPWPGMAMLDPARDRRGRHGAILLPFRALVAGIEQAK